MAIQEHEAATLVPSEALVTMTARAAEKLKEIITKQGREGLALRVYVTPGGCSGFSYGMTFADEFDAEDAVIENDGVRVVVDPMSAMYIKGSEIDFVDALMGGGFALRNPNAVSSCGCGQSFKTAGETGTAKACSH
ncbi:MAG: iron-sulfur cluster insertion protein ErpA [Chloroflexi bacterium]|nr:iron-sulfur cluster insertion protein ErpA [Chloroflexota bacterium]